MTSAHSPKTVAIIQARMASSRLPGKVLLDIGGEPMLARVVERASRANAVAQTVVATTTDPGDDVVEAYCDERGYPCYRGSSFDVLDRYYQAARLHRAEIVVRITADCPVIDPGLIDQIVEEFIRTQCDFAANRLPPPWGRTYPIGLDIEVCSFAGLELAWREAALPHQREHVMPFFYEQPERFHILLVNHSVDYGTLRWTVDTADDLELLRQIYAHFGDRNDFSWLDVLELFERQPELAQINAQVPPKDYRAADERGFPAK
jgi:spore coat polysaccharide biosynthesis protein SpsF